VINLSGTRFTRQGVPALRDALTSLAGMCLLDTESGEDVLTDLFGKARSSGTLRGREWTE
jgi:hypothetical protein